MIVDCAHYRDGRRQRRGPMRPEEAAAICGHDPASSISGWAAISTVPTFMILTALVLHRSFKRAGRL